MKKMLAVAFIVTACGGIEEEADTLDPLVGDQIGGSPASSGCPSCTIVSYLPGTNVGSAFADPRTALSDDRLSVSLGNRGGELILQATDRGTVALVEAVEFRVVTTSWSAYQLHSSRNLETWVDAGTHAGNSVVTVPCDGIEPLYLRISNPFSTRDPLPSAGPDIQYVRVAF